MENIIKEKRYKKELTYKGETILKYDISFPQIVRSEYTFGQEIFNRYNETIANELKKQAEGELFEQAKELYEYNKKNGYPVMVYEIMLVYNITYNNDNIISLYQEQYTFSGGAHGNTVKKSQNWDLKSGMQIPLYAWDYNQPYFILDIIKQIYVQIEKQKENYFEDYCCLVVNTFNPNSYYIVENGFVVYFQSYDIAPYSTGLPQFYIRK